MDIFHTFIYLPIHNLLVFLVDIVPGGDLGLAVIAATLIVKVILMPLSVAAVKTQKEMKELEPLLKELREKYKDNKEALAKETFALYKEHNVKPFASILLLFVQMPIVFGLYFVCRNAAVSALDPSLLYSFVSVPAHLSPLFLGIFSVTGSSLILAIVAGVTQFAQALYVVQVPPKSTSEKPSMQEDMARTMALQARFMFPLIIGAIGYTSGALALYFSASNLFMLAQELFIRVRHGKNS